MELADSRTHRCLKYAASVQRHGYKLTVRQFRAYARSPIRRADRTVTEDPFAGVFPNFNRLADSLFGRRTRTKPGESVLSYAMRVEWILVEGAAGEELNEADRIVVTDLGRAVLAALDEGSAEQDLPPTIVLDQDDPLAKSRLIGEIAELGEAALVDAYFSVDDLLAVLQRTEISRVLIGQQDRAKASALEQALADLSLPRAFEIRRSGEFHDRFVLAKNGRVLQIGTSLNGVGKRFSVLVSMNEGDAAADAILSRFEKVWAEADKLEPRNDLPPADRADPEKDQPDELGGT